MFPVFVVSRNIKTGNPCPCSLPPPDIDECIGVGDGVVFWFGVGVGVVVAFETHAASLISYLACGVREVVF